MFLDCLPVWQLHPCPHAQFIDFILLFTISKSYWSKTLPRSLLLHNERMTVKMLKTLTGISVCMKTWTVQNNPLRSELDIDWFIMSVTRCCHLKWLWTMLQSNDWFAPTLFLLSSVFHIVCENMDSMNLTDGETKAVLPWRATAVSLHIRTPCFKPKRSPYLFTFVFCLFMHMVSLSRFQVCQNQRPAARVKRQECKHWVQRGSADWGKGLWIWARNSPQWIMKTTLVSRPPSAASGGTSALKSN